MSWSNPNITEAEEWADDIAQYTRKVEKFQTELEEHAELLATEWVEPEQLIEDCKKIIMKTNDMINEAEAMAAEMEYRYGSKHRL